MGKVIALTNQKGGVGKTTAAINLASGLNRRGKRTLLVDLDAQGNASAACGFIIESNDHTIRDLLSAKANANDSVADYTDYIVKSDSVELIPSNNSLKDIESLLLADVNHSTLSTLLGPLRELYEYIIIDCPPSINVFTKNGLKAADEIIIPVDVGYFSLIGLKQLLEEIEYIRENLNPGLHIRGVLLSKFDKRTSLSNQVLDTLRDSFPDKLFKTCIRNSIEIVRSQISHKSIFEYSPRSSAAHDFQLLIEEITNG